MKWRARLAGLLYVISVASAEFAEAFVHGRLLHAVAFVPIGCFAALTLLLYGIFKSVNSSLALLAASASLVGLTFEATEVQPAGVNAALVLHGIYDLLIGYLAFKSKLVPRVFGVLMTLGGVGWLTALATLFGRDFSPYNVLLGFLGEGSLMLWLLVMGVPDQRENAL
jgi:hypothetical protein